MGNFCLNVAFSFLATVPGSPVGLWVSVLCVEHHDAPPPPSRLLIRPLHLPGEQGTAPVGFSLFSPSGRARKCRAPAGPHCLPVTERRVGLTLAFPSEAERLRIQARGSLFQKSLPGAPVPSTSRGYVSPATPNPSLLGSPQHPVLRDCAHPRLLEGVGLGWRVFSGRPPSQCSHGWRCHMGRVWRVRATTLAFNRDFLGCPGARLSNALPGEGLHLGPGQAWCLLTGPQHFRGPTCQCRASCVAGLRPAGFRGPCPPVCPLSVLHLSSGALEVGWCLV